MAIPHAGPGELIDATPLGDRLLEEKTHTLVKQENLEIIRMILPAGKEIPAHTAPRMIIVQCLEGRILFTADDHEFDMVPGNIIYLQPKVRHAVLAVDNSAVLLTIVGD